MILFIKVLVGFFALLYGIIGINEVKISKAVVSVVLIAMLIAMEVLPC